MRGLTLSYRLVAAALVAAVALLAVGGISFSPRQTHANIPNPTGVFCGALSNLRIDSVVQANFQGITLARVEDPAGPSTLAFTGVAYTAFGGPAFPACAAGTGTPPVPAAAQTGGRPIATGTWTPSGPGGTGTSTACALGLSLGSPVPIPGLVQADRQYPDHQARHHRGIIPAPQQPDPWHLRLRQRRRDYCRLRHRRLRRLHRRLRTHRHRAPVRARLGW